MEEKRNEMAKLILRNACYTGINSAEKGEIKATKRHKELVNEANRKIEKSRIRYATAYKNAGSYLGR